MSAAAPPDRPLADTLAAARAHADRHFGDGPAPAWQPSGGTPVGGGSQRFRRSRRAAVLLSAAVVLAAAWWASGRDHAAPPAAPAAAAPIESGSADDEDLAPPLPPRAGQSAPPPVAMPAAPVLNVTRRGTRWQVHAVGASRLAAALVLAELSGATLHGSTALLAATRPLHLHHWQGRSAAQAWQAVLGDEVNHALQCDAGRCQVWIVGGGALGAASPLPAAWPAAAVALPAAGMAPAAATAPAPSDSDDPRVSSHHD